MMQTVNERLRDESIAHAVWISRYSTGVAARMVKILNDKRLRKLTCSPADSTGQASIQVVLPF